MYNIILKFNSGNRNNVEIRAKNIFINGDKIIEIIGIEKLPHDMSEYKTMSKMLVPINNLLFVEIMEDGVDEKRVISDYSIGSIEVGSSVKCVSGWYEGCSGVVTELIKSSDRIVCDVKVLDDVNKKAVGEPMIRVPIYLLIKE